MTLLRLTGIAESLDGCDAQGLSGGGFGHILGGRVDMVGASLGRL